MKVVFIEGPLAQKVRKEAQRTILKKAIEAYTSVPQNGETYDRKVVGGDKG